MEAIIGIRGETIFKERFYYCWWTTDFLASKNHFSETLASDSFFPSNGNDVPRKSFTPASGNEFQS